MHFRYALVIALEEGDKILRKIIFVGIGERAHDAEIQRDVAPVSSHLYIARVHVGMEETFAEYLPAARNAHRQTPAGRAP